MNGHGGYVYSASFSPDGSKIVTGSYDRTVKVWDARTGAEILTFKGHTLPVTSAAFSPDGTRIVTGSGDCTAKVWDARSGAEVLTLKGHISSVNSASFSPDASRILTGSRDAARVWDARPFPGSTAAFADRLPAVLRGQDQPAELTERLVFAQMADDGRDFSAAARLWAEALSSEPDLDKECWNHYHWKSAHAAALAAAGHGDDAATLDETAKALLRRQALDGLRAELAAWTRHFEAGPPQARPAIPQTLQHWQEDPDLAGIRDAEGLAKLPEAERKQWQTLWADVEALRTRAGTNSPAPGPNVKS